MTQCPLALPQWTSEELWLAAGLHVGFHADGTPIPFNVFDFEERWGKPMLPCAGEELVWTATTPCASAAELRGLYPFHFGAMISPRVRRIIEDFDSTEVEFIPLRILSRETGALLEDWWFVNVFHWKDAFDLERSKLEYCEMPPSPRGSAAVSARFGPALITEIYELEALPEACSGGLFLARAPTENIWGRVFIGHELARRINEGVPKDLQVYFQAFALRDIPQPPRLPPALSAPGRRWRWRPW